MIDSLSIKKYVRLIFVFPNSFEKMLITVFAKRNLKHKVNLRAQIRSTKDFKITDDVSEKEFYWNSVRNKKAKIK